MPGEGFLCLAYANPMCDPRAICYSRREDCPYTPQPAQPKTRDIPQQWAKAKLPPVSSPSHKG